MSQRSSQTFVIATVSFSLIIWNLTFNLGAFRTIFFDRMFSIWVICTVLLITQFVLPKENRKLTVLGGISLIAPSLWVVLRYLDVGPALGIVVSDALYYLAFAMTLICLPYTFYLVMSFLQADVIAIQPKRLIVWLFAITAGVGFAGYFVGSHHDVFLFCEDFKVSGNDLPEQCFKEHQD